MLSQLIQCDVYTEQAAPIHFVQGEEGRQIQFNFINSIIDPVNPIDLTGKTVTIHILKPDNTFTVENCTVSQTSATYTLTENDCAAGGVGVYDLSIEDSGLLIYTAHGEYQGDYAAVEPGSITSYSQIFGLSFPDDFQLKLAAGANITIDTSQVPNIISSSGGGGGTSDYTSLTNKPSINGVTLVGNKTSTQLNITDTTYTAGTGLDLTGTVFSLDATVSSNISSALTKATAAMNALGSDYDPTNSYVVGDYCMYNSIMYKCNTDTTGAWDSACWDEIKVEWEFWDIKNLAYAIGDYLTALANAVSGSYDSSVTYNPNDIVVYMNDLYICTATTTGSWDSTKWSQITVASELTTLENKSIPAGGSSGQVLAKASGSDYDTTWITPSGGGGGGVGQVDTLYTGSAYAATINLLHDMFDYDNIIMEIADGNGYTRGSSFAPSELSTSQVIGLDNSYGYIWYTITSGTVLTAVSNSNYFISSIVGVKYGSATAATVSYDNTVSGLSATDVQDAIDEIDASVDTLNSKIAVETDTVDGIVFTKQGNIVSIYAYGISPASLPTVPEKYRPNDTLLFPITSIASSKLYNAYMGITSAGAMNCNYSSTYGGAPSPLTGGSVYFTVSYTV